MSKRFHSPSSLFLEEYNSSTKKSNSLISKENRNSIDSLATKQTKVILDEEKYFEKLDQVIEQNYFPHLPTLKKQLEYLNQYEKFNVKLLKNVYNELFPLTEINLDKNEDKNSSENNLLISEFFDKYISEDNYSYLKLQYKDRRKHFQDYSWAYKAIDDEKNKDHAEKAKYLMIEYINSDNRKVVKKNENNNNNKLVKFNSNSLFFNPSLSSSSLISSSPSPSSLISLPNAYSPKKLLKKKIINKNSIVSNGLNLVQSVDEFLRGNKIPESFEQIPSHSIDNGETFHTYTPLPLSNREKLSIKLEAETHISDLKIFNKKNRNFVSERNLNKSITNPSPSPLRRVQNLNPVAQALAMKTINKSK